MDGARSILGKPQIKLRNISCRAYMNIGYVLCHGHNINPIIHLSLTSVIRAIVNICEWFIWENKLWNPQVHEVMEGTSFILFLFF